MDKYKKKIKFSKMNTTKEHLKEYDSILKQVDFLTLICNGEIEQPKECSLPFSTNIHIIKIPSHVHPLKKHPDGHHKGWRCDCMKGANRCLSGMTDFH